MPQRRPVGPAQRALPPLLAPLVPAPDLQVTSPRGDRRRAIARSPLNPHRSRPPRVAQPALSRPVRKTPLLHEIIQTQNRIGWKTWRCQQIW